MDGLKDIKPLVIVPDVSLYYFIALVLGAVLILVLLIIGIFKWFKSRKESMEKRAQDILTNIDYADAKKAAYTISKWAIYLADTDAKQALHDELLQHLEPYKYRRSVPSFRAEDQAKVRAYLEACK